MRSEDNITNSVIDCSTLPHRLCSQTQEPAHDREKHLRLLAMHPVASFFDRDELNAREQRAHGGSVFRLDVG